MTPPPTHVHRRWGQFHHHTQVGKDKYHDVHTTHHRMTLLSPDHPDYIARPFGADPSLMPHLYA